MNLTREHITLTLGINLPLNESFENLNDQLKNRILYEQMLYESFLDSIKKYAGEKWDKVITTINDWKDAAVVLGKIITNPQTLQNFSDNFWKTFKSGLLKKLENLLKKLKLDKYIPQIENLINQISSLTGWKKFLSAVTIASITEYIVSKLSNLSAEGLTKWLQAYFSESALSTITNKLTDFTSYVGWLQPIIKGTEILFNILKPTIEKFKFAFNLKSQISEKSELKQKNTMKKSELKQKNTMKKSELKELIKEEIQNILNERVDELNVQTDTSEEGNKQITLSVLGGGWENNQITLSVEEAKELQQLAKTFIGSRKEISKGVNTKDKAFTQSTIGIKPDGLNCIIYRKEGSTYRGYDKPVEASSGYLEAQQSLVYQIAEEKLTEVNGTTPTQPAVKQTAASKAYQQTAQKASTLQSKAGQIKSVNDLPGVFQTWFDSLGLKGKPGVSQAAIISKIKDTLTKMGVK